MGDDGGEEDLSHVCSGGHSVTHVHSGDGGGEENLCWVHSGGCSVTHVLSWGWRRIGQSLPCMQWGMLTDTCPQLGMGGGK